MSVHWDNFQKTRCIGIDLKTHGRVEVSPSCIWIENISFPWESRYRRMRFHVIGHPFGVLAMIWAENLQDALDIAADAGFLNSCSVTEYSAALSQREHGDMDPLSYLGNAGEPFDLDDIWSEDVEITDVEDIRLYTEMAHGRGAGLQTLENL